MLDRIDIHVHVAAVDITKFAQTQSSNETSRAIQNRVQKAHQVQRERFNADNKNAHMTNRQIKKFCVLDNQLQSFFTKAAQTLELSARSYYKTLKVARTIADLEESQQIQKHHLSEALQYRHQQSQF